MKKLTLILLLSPLFGFAQADSASVKVNLSIQARDAEYIGSFISHNPDYEDLFDALKAKSRVAAPPSGNTLIAVDSIQVKAWLSISNVIRKDYIAVQAGVFSRLDAILRAKNNAYLTKLLDDAKNFDTRQYQETRRRGRITLRRKNE